MPVNCELKVRMQLMGVFSLMLGHQRDNCDVMSPDDVLRMMFTKRLISPMTKIRAISGGAYR